MVIGCTVDPVFKTNREPIYLSVLIKSDEMANFINRRINNSLQKAPHSATLESFSTTRPLIHTTHKDKLLVRSQNLVVSSFICSCTAEYIGRTTRQLKARMKEHHPAWLRSGDQKSIRSAVVAHLVESGHLVNSDESFRILYKAPYNLPRSIQARCINTAEAVAIRLRDPTLCHQKRFVQALRLPWPLTVDRSTGLSELTTLIPHAIPRSPT